MVLPTSSGFFEIANIIMSVCRKSCAPLLPEANIFMYGIGWSGTQIFQLATLSKEGDLVYVYTYT
jgi:hypothetical protein